MSHSEYHYLGKFEDWHFYLVYQTLAFESGQWFICRMDTEEFEWIYSRCMRYSKMPFYTGNDPKVNKAYLQVYQVVQKVLILI